MRDYAERDRKHWIETEARAQRLRERLAGATSRREKIAACVEYLGEKYLLARPLRRRDA